VIDVQRAKEKGYETVVKEGLCDEVRLAFSIFELPSVVCGILMLLCDCIHTIFVSIILRCCSFGSHDASLCCIFLRTWMLHSLTIHYSTLFVFLNLPTFSSNVVVFHLVS
jgi:hypothetical protein